jgi:hypothetical protein
VIYLDQCRPAAPESISGFRWDDSAGAAPRTYLDRAKGDELTLFMEKGIRDSSDPSQKSVTEGTPA